jgi:hypothetical protein
MIDNNYSCKSSMHTVEYLCQGVHPEGFSIYEHHHIIDTDRSCNQAAGDQSFDSLTVEIVEFR